MQKELCVNCHAVHHNMGALTYKKMGQENEVGFAFGINTEVLNEYVVNLQVQVPK